VSPIARSKTVRVRATLFATSVVALALGVGSVTLVWFLGNSMRSDLEHNAILRADDYAALISSGTPPQELDIRLEEDVIVQIVDGLGHPVAGSPMAPSDAPLAVVEPGDVAIDNFGTDDRYLLVARPAVLGTETFVVLLGRDLDDVAEATSALVAALLIGIPALLGLTASVCWVLVGRALGPVEAIRREVSEITRSRLHTRVSIPDTGDEVSLLADTMNDMLERLERSQTAQTRLVSNVAHELKNPIAAIRQHAEVAQAHPDEATADEVGRAILTEALRLQELTEDLLFLARADEDAVVFEPSSIPLRPLVESEVARMATVARVPISMTRMEDVVIEGDASLLARLVANLLDNAVRYASENVSVSLKKDGQRNLLRIEDDGPGIPESQRGEVLERFVRLDDSRARSIGGSGLGLAIVAEVAALHGGDVAVTESPLGGARIDVRFTD
jgi:signal transduction histidine kinase